MIDVVWPTIALAAVRSGVAAVPLAKSCTVVVAAEPVYTWPLSNDWENVPPVVVQAGPHHGLAVPLAAVLLV